MAIRPLSVRVLLLAGIVLALEVPAVQAQEPARRPFRRLFGDIRERPDRVHRLDLRFSLAGTLDDNQRAAGEALDDEPRAYPSGSVDARYSRRFTSATLQVGGASSAQYYVGDGRSVDHSHSLGLDLSVPFNTRTRFRVAQTASYATFATLLGLPGSAIADPGTSVPGGELLNPGEPGRAGTGGGWQFNTHAALSRQFRHRGSLETRYSFARTDLADVLTQFHEAGIRYSHPLTRQASVVAGYSYQRGRRDAAPAPVEFHDIDLGVSYSRRLPGLRNTSVALSTGSAVLRTDTGNELRLLGDVRLVHLMGRTWTGAVSYHRGVEYVDVLAQAVASEAVSATLNGFASRRLETWLSSSYSRGNLGSSDGGAVNSLSMVARAQFALSRRLALDTQYIHYFHEFGQDAAIPGSFARRLRRNAVRVGLTFLAPSLR